MGNAKMRYALVDGEKRLPEKGLRGKCPVCGAEVTSRCGNVKIHHWAHMNAEDCDSWSEGKTEWHVDWQNQFPKEWQEDIIEKEGRKHIADVRVRDQAGNPKFVIEFQHSYIEPETIKEREEFYGDMLWVVDLTSKKRELNRLRGFFYAAKQMPLIKGAPYRGNGFLDRLPQNWVSCSKYVILDLPDGTSTATDILVCLYPRLAQDPAQWFAIFTRCIFKKMVLEGTLMYTLDGFFKEIQRHLGIVPLEEQPQKQQTRKIFPSFFRNGGWHSPRL